MIDKIHIKALKSIKDLTIQCARLNLFTGTNSSGKSTFLQALLLMAQKNLNGKLISIGEFREVRNYSMPGETVRIEIWSNGKTDSQWIEFLEDKKDETYRVCTSCDENGTDLKDQDFVFSGDSKLHYLSCHRIGVRDIYEKNMLEESDFGIDGQYALAYLLNHESDAVSEKLVADSEKTTNSLLEQVNYWLDYIVGTVLSISDLKKTNYLQVKYNNNPLNASSEALFCRPVNVGSGISYLISIIITCLGAEEGCTIMIENPEIHLHPKAQSKLCDFLYFVSQAGRQLFLETHSDHIFNGLRAGVATKTIQQEDIAVNFFALNDQYETQCNKIIFKEFGKIAGTNENMDIEDLFDQFEIDLDRMLGL